MEWSLREITVHAPASLPSSFLPLPDTLIAHDHRTLFWDIAINKTLLMCLHGIYTLSPVFLEFAPYQRRYVILRIVSYNCGDYCEEVYGSKRVYRQGSWVEVRG